MCIKGLPEAKEEVSPPHQHMGAKQQGTPKSSEDIANNMFDGVGIFGVEGHGDFELVMLFVDAFVEEFVVEHCFVCIGVCVRERGVSEMSEMSEGE